MKLLITSLTLAAFAAVVSPLRADEKDKAADGKATDAKMNIVETASGMNNFTTLVSAVQAAGLAETLSGDGPFTVFAPTNDAFAKLPEGTVDDLLKPENKDKLKSILTYHVVPGKVMASDVKSGEVETVNGKMITVSMDGDTVMIDKAKVIKTDVVASNGVIHWIDGVLMPE